jgi:hypothetical protein
MWAFAKAVLLLARYARRIAVSLEQIRDLYELELRYQGIVQLKSEVTDEVEVVYGAQPPAQNQI